MKFIEMGNCMKKKAQNNEREVSIYVFGLDDAGKTTISKVISGDFNLKDIVPTIGYQPTRFRFKSFDVNMIESGGGERVRDLYKHYVAECYGYIFIVDTSNHKRIDECKRELHKFIENDKVSGKAILILGNKQDKTNALDESELVDLLMLEEISNKTSTLCRVETCVGLRNINTKADEPIRNGFEWLMKYIDVNYEALKSRIDKDVQIQKLREERERKEKEDKVKQKRQLTKPSMYDLEEKEDDKLNNFNTKRDPFRPLNELKLTKENEDKFANLSMNSNKSFYEKQLDIQKPSPRTRLNPIDEEKPKPKIPNRFLNNKLNPTKSDVADLDRPYSRAGASGTSWAITDMAPSKRAVSPF